MPTKATDALLKDHQLVRKVLEQFQLDHPRFEHICRTLHRAVKAHAWFEDEIFLPAVKHEPLFFDRFMAEIEEEHKDIDRLLQLVRTTSIADRRALEAYALQARTLLDTHFAKEEDALFPLADRLLTEEGLNQLGEEMKKRQAEVRQILE
jgi:hemerythrin-like domain-containing protein